MNGRTYFSIATDQLGKIFSPEATSFRATAELLVVGGIAHLNNSTWLAYTSYTLALVEAALGVKQWTAARFFAEKKVTPVVVATKPDKYFDADSEPEPAIKLKKSE